MGQRADVSSPAPTTSIDLWHSGLRWTPSARNGRERLTVSRQVPQVHRQVLQQLHLLLRHRRQRQVPAAPPARRPRYRRRRRRGRRLGVEQPRLVDGRRRQPDERRDRGGHSQFFRRGVRELDQGRHEPVLPRQHARVEPCVSHPRCGGRAQVPLAHAHSKDIHTKARVPHT